MTRPGQPASGEAGIFLGRGEAPVGLLARMANRHGLIAGATGTGKTATLLTMTEGYRRRERLAEAMMKSAGRAIAGEVGRRIIRGVLGSILK